MTHPTAADLEGVFRRIADTRMAGLPILNPELSVAAVGFRPWQDGSIGVLVTPWFMNLICLPGPTADWQGMTEGSPLMLQLPAGEVEFLVAGEEDLGSYLSCSLFSPMAGFADMAGAHAVAEGVMKELFAPGSTETAPPAPGGLSEKMAQPVSRRGFLSALLPREPRS